MIREAARAAMPKKPVKKQEEYEVEYITVSLLLIFPPICLCSACWLYSKS